MEGEDISTVAYTVTGKPLSLSQYKAEVQKGIDDVQAGKIASHGDLLKEIANW